MKSRAPERWSMAGAMKVGIIVGAISILSTWLGKDELESWPREIGLVIGQLLGAVFFACVVATVRNALIFGRRKI